MITAIDTNVLIDILNRDPTFASESWDRLMNAHRHGELIICDIVYAELVSAKSDRSALDEELRDLHVRPSPADFDIAYEAGLRWARYRRAGGPRTRVLPDFLIGAHAIIRANALLTRDHGVFTTYFQDLELA